MDCENNENKNNSIDIGNAENPVVWHQDNKLPLKSNYFKKNLGRYANIIKHSMRFDNFFNNNQTNQLQSTDNDSPQPEPVITFLHKRCSYDGTYIFFLNWSFYTIYSCTKYSIIKFLI